MCFLLILLIKELVAGRSFSQGTPVSSINKTDRHYITEILLKVILLLSYYGLLTREPFSYSVVWVGIVPKPVGEDTIPSQTTL